MNQQLKKWNLNRPSIRLLGAVIVLIVFLSQMNFLFELFNIKKTYATASMTYGIGMMLLAMAGFVIGGMDVRSNKFDKKLSKEGFTVIAVSLLPFGYAISFILKAL